MSIQELSQKLIDDMATILAGGTVEPVVEDASNDKSDDGEGLDKVDKKATKKKFKDRKDKDIDNDGDTDDSDEFLHKRRKAISKNIKQDESVKEEVCDVCGKEPCECEEDTEEQKEGKYAKYSDLLLKKQRMSKDADKTAINKEISKERKKLGISEENLEDLLILFLPEQED